MLFKQLYHSPLGDILLAAADDVLLGTWFVGQKYELSGFEKIDFTEQENTVLSATEDWLEAYFAGVPLPLPDFLSPQGTVFQQRVWTLLTHIPFGQTVTYGEIAEELRCRSAQAVGGAVRKNPISIFIPCHRVLGSRGQLTGYAGGLDRKYWLLEHEGVKEDRLFLQINKGSRQ
ncbi:methylated-DNA--[protein]-cysteine S-methyltransferase [Streptococcus sp. H31]|uniref:methylated-DNA--[protein]-cysteine S-methyltransferase n=1 Tax=Streptococcus huangxiaojuni TaxID=3237239 RepID=UPI0034A14184